MGQRIEHLPSIIATEQEKCQVYVTGCVLMNAKDYNWLGAQLLMTSVSALLTRPCECHILLAGIGNAWNV